MKAGKPTGRHGSFPECLRDVLVAGWTCGGSRIDSDDGARTVGSDPDCADIACRERFSTGSAQAIVASSDSFTW